MWEQVIRASPLELSISRLRLAVFFLGNPTNKTGTAYMWGLLIANHLDQSLWSNNQKYWAAVRYNLLHSFLEVHNCVASFTSHGKLHEFGEEKPIPWAKPAHFDFLAINFTVWSHMVSTVGDSLSGFMLIVCTNQLFKHQTPMPLAINHLTDTNVLWKCKWNKCKHDFLWVQVWTQVSLALKW